MGACRLLGLIFSLDYGSSRVTMLQAGSSIPSEVTVFFDSSELTYSLFQPQLNLSDK
jgi:hypothetical protein